MQFSARTRREYYLGFLYRTAPVIKILYASRSKVATIEAGQVSERSTGINTCKRIGIWYTETNKCKFPSLYAFSSHNAWNEYTATRTCVSVHTFRLWNYWGHWDIWTLTEGELSHLSVYTTEFNTCFTCRINQILLISSTTATHARIQYLVRISLTFAILFFKSFWNCEYLTKQKEK